MAEEDNMEYVMVGDDSSDMDNCSTDEEDNNWLEEHLAQIMEETKADEVRGVMLHHFLFHFVSQQTRNHRLKKMLSHI